MSGVHPVSNRTSTPFPYPTLCRSAVGTTLGEGLVVLHRAGTVGVAGDPQGDGGVRQGGIQRLAHDGVVARGVAGAVEVEQHDELRSEEHTSELQSLMSISYAVFCLKKIKLMGSNSHNT